MAGVSAQMFQQLAWVVSFSLFCSLTVALTLVPMLCSRYLRVREAGGASQGTLARRVAEAHERMSDRYGQVISWAVDHRKTVVLTAVEAARRRLLFVRVRWCRAPAGGR